MELQTLLAAAIQSSFLLGLLHGVNPCGHSWLVLAPFVSGERNGQRVTLLTTTFVTGTALACLALGATLGAVSQLLPVSLGLWVESVTSVLLIIIGLLLLYRPQILHNHDHGHDHGHGCHHHDHHHHHHDDHHLQHHPAGLLSRIKTGFKALTPNRKSLPLILFVIGFINMIVPCPTAAVMYGYALRSGSVLTALLVFGSYALSTALAVGGVIFLIFKATTMAASLQKDWVEPLIMRLAGFVILVFSGYGLLQTVTV
ncbi:urease accessory protein UreH domain-containing protein [Desulfogranum mediterraneum]|uniref:urease accessory protein UreH domain-containing protein n=1 Tax=Desulfogranum mediterraneum TaxID=160661 RepID=UPI0004012F88|nr:sulfite exporter TauE/SafE family protein [Desulfogranum mediterraneum]